MPSEMPESLSSRRAWIEMLHLPHQRPVLQGRSPRGGRGLKYGTMGQEVSERAGSLSSRRAWIEIEIEGRRGNEPLQVALLAEGVD